MAGPKAGDDRAAAEPGTGEQAVPGDTRETGGAGTCGEQAVPGEVPEAGGAGDMELYDLRVVVDRIEGRSVCGMRVGDRFELERSAHLRLPDGKHFCVYALAAVLPFLAAKQRDLAAGDWLAQDSLFACPDPEERLVMRVERTRRRRMNSADLT
ncbi:TIGR04076 family protein [Sphaerisporangium viridialbum]|uniref:TIGR04076 family protein n=1 Tax=Sphaerisporangium viridialbum TaxID=46189 RepID=UPI003C71C6DB